jgi:hypothetical protein
LPPQENCISTERIIIMQLNEKVGSNKQNSSTLSLLRKALNAFGSCKMMLSDKASISCMPA